MGRKKIAIEKIENAKNRAVTFRKRRYGFFKKATELSKLCDVDISIIITSRMQRGAKPGALKQDDPITTFSSTDLQQHLQNFVAYSGETVHFSADLPTPSAASAATDSAADSPNRFAAADGTTPRVPADGHRCAVAPPASQVAAPGFEVLRPIPTKPGTGAKQPPFIR